MPSQVLVRKQNAMNRDSQLLVAEVLGTKSGGEVYRVQVRGEKLPRDVRASDTLPISTVAPGQARIGGLTRPPEKAFPTSRSALANVL